MARQPAPPRIKKWRGRPTLFFYDYNKCSTVRQSVAHLTPKQRKKAVQDRTVEFRKQQSEAAAGYVVTSAFDTKLRDGMASFREHTAKRVAARKKNEAARVGLAEKSGVSLFSTLGYFESWLLATKLTNLTTGALSAHHLEDFFHWLSLSKSRHGKREVKRSAATLNRHRRNMRSMLGWLNRGRPKLLRDFEPLVWACKVQPVDTPEPEAFTPDELRRFYDALRERELPEYRKTVRDKRRGSWQQSAAATACTPQSALFLLLALTGLRLSEALALRWQDVDFTEGMRTSGCITIRSGKTGKRRWLPLVGAREGDVAPGLFEELKRWKLTAGEREYVLPHAKRTRANPNPKPVLVRRAWIEVGKHPLVNLRRLGPQALRRNMCSYLSSQGVPASVAADWLGHATRVAERFYKGQVLQRREGSSIEAAMGLGVFPLNSGTKAV